jgi:6-methylsalicylate decarboxylase
LKKYNRKAFAGLAGWALSKDLEDLEKGGTATAILSISGAGFGFGETNEARGVIRECNEAAAKLRSDQAGLFGSFAALPLTDIEGSLREAEYAIDMLKADGIGVFSNYGDKWLGNQLFAPVYEELNRRKAIVFVHPLDATCCGDLGLDLDGVPNSNAMLEYNPDTTRTIASLIFSGTTRRFPSIKWIFSHAGGTMPYVIERFFQNGQSAEIVPGIVTKGQSGTTVENPSTGNEVLGELRRLYYDTAQSANPVTMRALRTVVPVSKILFGTDYWFRTAEETARGLETCKVFNAAELRAINRGNAETLFPRYQSRSRHH